MLLLLKKMVILGLHNKFNWQTRHITLVCYLAKEPISSPKVINDNQLYQVSRITAKPHYWTFWALRIGKA